ncbi:hypothetical protein KEM56_002602 [Ascosphaera pollenicola]|nr:hypothetical protein KEM56_002602 [Ascosphaera pollenicola]
MDHSATDDDARSLNNSGRLRDGSAGAQSLRDETIASSSFAQNLSSPSTDSVEKRKLGSSSASIASNESSSKGFSKFLSSSKRRRRKQRETEEANQQLTVPESNVSGDHMEDLPESEVDTNDFDHDSFHGAPGSTAADSVEGADSRSQPVAKDTMGALKPSRRRASTRRSSVTGPASTRERLKDIFSSSSRNPSPNPDRSNNSNTKLKKSKTGLPPSSDDGSKQHTRADSDSALQNTIEFPPLDDALEAPPDIVQSPETTVTPPTPERKARLQDGKLPSANISDVIENAPESISGSSNGSRPPHPPQVIVSPSGHMISHRRVRSAAASTSMPPLSKSPTLAKTPEESRSRNQSSALGSGFFASMFSAAQNAMGISQATPPEPHQDLKSTTDPSGAYESEVRSASSEARRKLAVDTLGEGELNLSDLGIDATSGGVVTTKDGVTFTPIDTSIANSKSNAAQRDELSAKIEELRSARAVVTNSLGGTSRKSAKDSLKGKSRRPRISSGATVNALGAAGLGLSGAAGRPGIQRLTGFAVASKKRNKDFHSLFRSVPEDDYLIEDYSCALQREIILAGRIYISEGHICFSSNILGWVTTLVISFDEIIAIEKETTAMVFPNAIAIQTLHARHVFRSLLSREATYDLMVSIWRINHPTLRSSVNGTRIESGTGDKTEKMDESEIRSLSGSELSEDEVYDEDEDESGPIDNNSHDGSEKSGSSKKAGSGAASNSPASPALPGQTSKTSKGDNGGGGGGGDAANDFPGPATHEPTEFTDPSGQYDKMLKDEIIQAPLGQVYNLTFGPASASFLKKFLIENQKVFDVQQLEDDKKGLDADVKSRTYSYIRPLNASIGPKQTKCITNETLDFFDLDKAVVVTSSTQSPDVPSGNVFTVKTKYLLTWAKNNATRVYVSCTVEWTGKSWFKGPIEKGSNDGQLAYAEDLLKAIRATVSSRSRGLTTSSKNGKGSKSKRKREPAKEAETVAEKSAPGADTTASSWGAFEPLHAPLSAVGGALKPLFTGNMAVIVILLLVILSWFRASSVPTKNAHPVHLSLHERLALYEDLWLRQESELWDWLEERIHLKDQSYLPTNGEPRQQNYRARKQLANAEKTLGAHMDEGKMTHQEMEEALKLTQARLEVLQSAIQKRSSKAQSSKDPST